MTAFIAILMALFQALAPLVPKLLAGHITLVEAKKAADEAVARYQKDASDLLAVEAADDAAADAAAQKG